MISIIKRNKILKVILVLLVALSLVACNKTEDNLIPNLDGLNEIEIREKFEETDLIVTLNFQMKLALDLEEGIFLGFADDLNFGDEVENGTLITIYVSSKSIILPNLEGLNQDEIRLELEKYGVSSKELTLRPEINKNVAIGTFTRYDKARAGDLFTFDKKLLIYYDMSKALPDLTNLNKFEIEELFEDLTVPIEFNYKLDNSKEFDSFASYEDRTVGESVSFEDEVVINIYKNDDVNTENNIANEFELFISKYADGLNNNKALELFNPTSEDINLDDYYIAILENGSLTMSREVKLEGVLKPNETFVIVNNSAESTELLNKANLKSEELIFDGNDTIQLRKTSNDTYIDSIYHVGNISRTMDEEIFVRKTEITSGNRDFKQIEWLGFIPSYITPVGTHPWSEVDLIGPEFVLIPDKTFKEYGMTKVEITTVNDGDTMHAISLDPRDTTSYAGDQRLRFLMVDTPETTKPGVVGEPYANVATRFTKKLTDEATEIYLQSDRSAGLTGTYGRNLSLIWLKLPEDIIFTDIAATGTVTIKKGWRLLNYELIKNGLGDKSIAKTVKYREAPIFSNRYLYQWGNEAENFAKANELGIFSGKHRS